MICVFLLALPALAHPVADRDRDAVAARRTRLMESIGGDYALLLAQPFSGVSQPRQEGDFLYLTAVREPAGALLLAGKGSAGLLEEKPAALLFLPDLAPRTAQFMAADFLPDDETGKLLGIAVRPIPRRPTPFALALAARLPPNATLRIPRYRGGDHAPLRDRKRKILDDLKRSRPDLKIADLDPLVARMRAVKEPLEVQHLQRAIDISIAAFGVAAHEIRDGGSEAAVEVALLGSIRRGGGRPAFPFVVGSGRDAARPHYFRNANRLAPGSLLVIDAGAAFKRYAADITRTYPVAGRFTERQREVYTAVLEAQKAAIASVRPGTSFAAIDRVARNVLKKRGLAQHFIHGTCHHVGLDVHDPGPSKKLMAGMTLTVEPGVYILKERLGVRIEDIVHVTAYGCVVLTAALPKEIDAVETFLAEARAR